MFSRSINSIGQTTTRFIASTRAIPARHIVHPPRPQPTYLLGVAGPSRSVHSTPSPYKRHITAPQAHIRKRPPRGLSNDPATLPPGYTIYPHHSDRLDTPPKMTHIHVSPHAAPPLPRCSIFDYLSPPEMKGKQPVYYPTPNSQGIAFIDGLTGESITRKELMEEARYLATGLRTLHVESGQVALLFGFNSLHYVKAILGCQALGVIVSPANAGYTPDELAHQITDSTAGTIFVQPALLHTLLKALDIAKAANNSVDIPPQRIILLCSDAGKPADSPYRTIHETRIPKMYNPGRLNHGDETRPAYLCYSSGTTGRAKGVETSHHNMTSQIQAFNVSCEKLRPQKDVILGILPLSHIYGLALLVHHPLTVGVPVVILPRFEEIAVLKAIQKYKITWALVVPPVLIVLLHSKNVANYDTRSLRGLMSGAAPLSADLASAVQARLNLTVTQGYGLTETSPVINVMNCEESEQPGRKGRIGQLIPTYQARLVDESGKDVGINTRGELWVRGPSVMKGYWRNEQATQNAFADGGWFKTGDVAEVDEQGYFAIVDRVKELIKYKGFQVPPAELEALLLTHPEVADAAVIALQSPSEGTELPRAYVVPLDGVASLPSQADKEAFSAKIAKWVEGKVANHKRLRGGVVLIEAIPKSPSGKILRKDLRAKAKVEMEEKVKSGREAKL